MWAPIIALLVVVTMSFVLMRLASVALQLTGISQDMARLQVMSAYMGVGFTTSESEGIVNHPLRRRILVLLMLFGNAGFITVVGSLVLTFVTASGTTDILSRVGTLFAGLAVIVWASTSRWIDGLLTRLVRWGLARWTSMEAIDYMDLLHLEGDYSVQEIEIAEDSWLVGATLEQTRLSKEGVTVLGVHRGDGHYVGTPRGETALFTGDRLIVYGREKAIDELRHRPPGYRGEAAHEQAVEDCEREREKQQIEQEQLKATVQGP